jgi:arabinogalactan endo-1,4-beta-galactosidase
MVNQGGFIAFNTLLLLFAMVLFSCKQRVLDEPPLEEKLVYRAADLSALPMIEASTGAKSTFYNEDSVAQDALSIFKESGCNTVRLRIWHTPNSTHSSFDEVKTFAARIRAKGMKLWLTIHYSDWWADPSQQMPPAAWAGLSATEMADSVYAYTFKLASALKPEILQIGNEINNGFLWPSGHSNSPAQFHNLLAKGIAATRDASPNTQIMLHYAGIDGALAFFEELDTLDFDQIGISYYPRWHEQNVTVVEAFFYTLSQQSNKDILIAETAYPFTLGYNDWTNNLVGMPEHLLNGYPATPKGQADFMAFIKKLMIDTEHARGFCYWAPEWVAYKGPQATDGSPWENMAMFNFNNRALKSIENFSH